MPTQKIQSTRRAHAAIAATMSVSVAVGGVWYGLRKNDDPIPSAVMLAENTLIRPWEGTELRDYYDRVAKPPVWTICSGDTNNVRPGMVETPAGCDRRLQTRLAKEFYPGLQKCIVSFNTRPVAWQAMMISLSWNIGVGGACTSTAARLGRAGDYRGSCLAATAFNKAGGKMIIGLVKRREMGDISRIGEAELCVSGL